MINHRRQTNVLITHKAENLIFIYAAEDIRKGEELFINYFENTFSQVKRNKYLMKYGITERTLRPV